MEELLYAGESYAMRGAIFEVYRDTGSGFLEPVYQECLEKDSPNLDCFRAFPSVPWLKNWFPMDMQTAFDTVVCLFAFRHELDKLPCRGSSQKNHSTKEAGMSQSLPLGV